MQILTCSEDKRVGVYDLKSNSLFHHWQGHQKAVTRISYMPLTGLAVMTATTNHILPRMSNIIYDHCERM